MDYTKFVADLPEQKRIVFGSPEENEETLNRFGISQTVRQIGKGPFRSDLITSSGPQADFFADRFNRAVSLGLALPAGQVGFLFPRSASGDFRVSGRDTGTDKLIVFSGGTEVDIFVPDLAGSEGIQSARRNMKHCSRHYSLSRLLRKVISYASSKETRGSFKV